MAGFGFNKSRDVSQSNSLDFGISQAGSFVSGEQAPFLDFLRNAGVDLFSQQQFGLQQQFGQSQDLFQQGQSLVSGLTNNPFLQSLQNQAGGNPQLVQQQTDQLGTDLGRFFNEQLVPGINQGGIAAGQFGQSRGDIGRGLAAQGVTEQFQRGATGLQEADAARAQQAGIAGGSLFNQGQLGGLQALSGLQGLTESPFAQQLQPLMALIQAIGGPNVLQSSQSFDFGTSSQSSRGTSFGANISGI